MVIFHSVRKQALQTWAGFTKRRITDEFGELLSDDFAGAYECKWQKAHEGRHVNLFCSLGEWGSNITDLLKDSRFDYLDLTSEKDAKVVFRYYTRLMLVVSEMMTDFQDIYKCLEELPAKAKESNTAARDFYSQYHGKAIYQNVFTFINSVCKHKTGNLHSCNNHLPIYFEDAGNVAPATDYISLEKYEAEKKYTGILMPKLMVLINLLTASYHLLDVQFTKEPKKFEQLCHKFSD